MDNKKTAVRRVSAPGRTLAVCAAIATAVWIATAAPAAHAAEPAARGHIQLAQINIRINEGLLRLRLRQQGYDQIRDIRVIKVQGRDYYAARARKDGKQLLVVARMDTGRVVHTRAAAAGPDDRLDQRALRQRLRRAGYRRIRGIELIKRNGRDFYRAEARKDGKNWRLLARADNGRIVNAREIGGAALNEQQLRQKLRQQGYRSIDNLRGARRGNRDVYVANAQKGGKKYRVIARADNGRVINARETGDVALNEQQVRQKLRQQGYRSIDNLRRARRGNRDVYVANAQKGGKKFRLVARSDNGRVINARETGDVALNEQELRQKLRQQGYRRIGDVKQVRRGNRLLYTANAVKGGKSYRLVARANDGRVINARETGDAVLGERRIRRALQQQGYSDVDNLRRVTRNGRVLYLAEAVKGGRTFSLTIRGRDGRVLDADAQGLSARQIRRRLRRAGYTNIRDLRRVTRNNRVLYRATADKDGREYRLLARADNGAIVRARATGPQAMDEQRVRRRLRRAGYRNIGALRLVERGGNLRYWGRAERDGSVWRLLINAENGQVVRRRELRALRASDAAVKSALERAGYANVDNIRYQGGNDPHFLARGWNNGYLWEVRADDQTGRPIARRRVGGRIGERALTRRLGRAGYSSVDVLRWVPDGRAGNYVVVANRGNVRYRLVVRGENGAVARRAALDARQVPVEVVRRVIRGGGYRYIDGLTWIAARGIYQGNAWQNGYQWRVLVRGRDGRLLSRRRIGGRIDDGRVRQVLGANGYGGIRNLRWVPDGRAGYYVARATRNGRQVQVYARATTGRPYRTVVLEDRLNADAVTRRLLSAGYEKVSDVTFKDGDTPHFEANVWKNGHRYQVRARPADAQVYHQTLLEPRASRVDVEDVLLDEGYENIDGIKFVEDPAGGHYEATASRNGRKYRLYLRAHDGSLYRRVVTGR